MNHKLRAGIIGCGGISTMHAANYQRSDIVELVAGADLSTTALEGFASRNPGVRTYPSYAAMLEQEKLDLVSICTPAVAHVEPAIAAAEAGVRGILVEKPMAMNLADADRIVERAADHGVTLAVGHQLRCSGPYLTAKRMIAAGEIGEVQRIWGVCHRAPTQTNGTHTIDLIRYLSGDAPVEWVMGTVDRGPGRKREGIPQEDAAVGFFQFKGGPIGLFEAGDLEPTRGYHHLYVDGEDGQIELTRPGGTALRFRSQKTAGEWQVPVIGEEINPVDDLAEAVLTGREALSSGAQGRATLELVLALFESARTLRRVPLPLANRQNPLEQIYASTSAQ